MILVCYVAYTHCKISYLLAEEHWMWATFFIQCLQTFFTNFLHVFQRFLFSSQRLLHLWLSCHTRRAQVHRPLSLVRQEIRSRCRGPKVSTLMKTSHRSRCNGVVISQQSQSPDGALNLTTTLPRGDRSHGSQQSWNSRNSEGVRKFEIVLKSQSFSTNVLILTIVVRAQWQFNVLHAALLICLLHALHSNTVLLCHVWSK